MDISLAYWDYKKRQASGEQLPVSQEAMQQALDKVRTR